MKKLYDRPEMTITSMSTEGNIMLSGVTATIQDGTNAKFGSIKASGLWNS